MRRNLRRMVPFVLLAALGCGGSAAVEDSSADAEAMPAITLADLGTVEEARTFLASGAVWSEDLSVTDLRSLIEELYAAGAPRVLFADIETIENQRVSALLAVEMPASGPARQRVLTAYSRAAALQGESPETDSGQSYLTLALD